MTVQSDIGPFAIVPEWLLLSDVSSNAVRVFAILHRYAGADGRCFPGREALSSKFHCSPSTIDRALRELESVGALSVQSRTRANGSQTTNEYRVHIAPPKVDNAVDGSSPVTRGVVTRDEGGVCKDDDPLTITSINEISLSYERELSAQPKTDEPKKRRTTKAGVTPLTDEERARLLAEFHDLENCADQIDLATSHIAAQKYPQNQYGYVRNWLRRDRNDRAQRKGGTTNGRPTTRLRNDDAPSDAYDYLRRHGRVG